MEDWDHWYDEKGFLINYPKMLMNALRAIPGAPQLSDERIRGLADILESVSGGGRDEEQPRNRAASPNATDKEIRKLHDLCEKLAVHIESLRQPAVTALFNEGLLIFQLLADVKEAQEIARYSFGCEIANDESLGRPKKIQAAGVTEMAGHIYEKISGRRPTFTTDPETGAISGQWPHVLGLIFRALYIDASVASQVRALSVKSLSD